MRLMVLTVLSLASVTAFAAPAKTVLHVPFFVEISDGAASPKYTYVPVSEINKELVKKGQAAQQESVDLETGVRFDAMTVSDKLDAALAAAGIKNAQAAREAVPATYASAKESTCYRGDAAGVADIVSANTDNLYSDQFQLHGVRIGTDVTTEDGSTDMTVSDSIFYLLQEQSQAWASYDTASDSVLIVSSVGDDGTDIEESLIPRCK